MPLTTQMLPVGDGHMLYVETVGSPDGIPAVFLHGGPGSGCQPSHRELFDHRFRAVLFDQRGAGRSTPARERTGNTTAHLVADMETIRDVLGIERWLVVGGSWGATLALVYAQQHPDRVTGLVLRATFLGTRVELDEAFGDNLKRVHPELHQDFLEILPPHERDQPLDNYWRRILSPDPAVHGPAARAWHDTERVLSQLRPARTRLDLKAIGDTAGAVPATALMEAHYFSHDCFLAPEQILREAGSLSGIPGVIVQGRYDLLCPPGRSQALAGQWSDARVLMVEGAGHSLSEPGVTEAVMAAVSSFG